MDTKAKPYLRLASYDWNLDHKDAVLGKDDSTGRRFPFSSHIHGPVRVTDRYGHIREYTMIQRTEGYGSVKHGLSRIIIGYSNVRIDLYRNGNPLSTLEFDGQTGQEKDRLDKFGYFKDLTPADFMK